MQVRRQSSLTPAHGLALLGLLVSTLMLGYFLGKRQHGLSPGAEGSGRPGRPARPAATADPTEYELPELRITLQPEDYEALLDARERAIELGHIAKSLKRYYPARIGEAEHEAKLRLKGDLLDHVGSDRWSMRIALKDESYDGVKTFSIQSPRTRGYLWEWLGHRAARREGLLAPRSRFVSVVQQGLPRGVYFLEEHFTKDLLESQGRREGPIVKFDEEVFWAQSSLRTQGAHQTFPPPHATSVARITAFDEERLARDEVLARELSDGLARLESLMQAAIAAWEADHPLGIDRAEQGAAARNELWKSQAAWVEDTVDLRQAAKLHALLSLLHSYHGLAKHNLRFYFDPVAAKLEPIFFDSMAMQTASPSVAIGHSESLAKNHLIIRAYRASPLYRETFAIELARMLAPGYLEDLLEELGPELRHLEAQLLASGDLPAKHTLKQMRSQLMGSRATLRKSLYPSAPLGAVARQRIEAGTEGRLEIDLWATTEVPVVVEAFIFENGQELPALEVAAKPVASVQGGALIIGTGQRARFGFDADSRLAGLVKFKDLVADLSKGQEVQKSRGLRIKLRWRYASESTTQEMDLDSRVEHRSWWEAGSRPRSPRLSEALERHPFLAWDTNDSTLQVLKGSWDVQGDLVVPEQLDLHIPAGTELRFEPGAVLLSHDALLFEGTLEAPIRLQAQQPAAGWAGIVVLDAERSSSWRHTFVKDASFVERAGWITTGGVTFYRSALDMLGGGFEASSGEDALNLFGTSAELRGVHFNVSASDALDGDFVQLLVEDCHFQGIAADAVDTSGSQVQVIDCSFVDIGDKCISIGERSQATVRGGRVEGAAIGIASKDQSEVDVEGLSLSGLRNFALAAYRKKAVFGPASIQARALVNRDPELRALAQTDSTISIDGELQSSVSFDPKELYADGILGN